MNSIKNKVKQLWIRVIIGGCKRDNLKEETILKLQNFFRKAIKDNEKWNQLSLQHYTIVCIQTKNQFTIIVQLGPNHDAFNQCAMACNEQPKSHESMKTHLSLQIP